MAANLNQPLMKLFFLSAALLAATFAQAQANFQGVAVYKTMTSFKDMDIKIEGDPAMEAQIRETFAKGMESEYTLAFNKSESIYEEIQKLDPEVGGGMGSFSFGDGKKYVNLKDKVSIKETDMFDKDFIVTDSLHKRDWKLSSETKKIGNYTCYKATDTLKFEPITQEAADKAKESGVDLLSMMKPRTIVYTAWYTPEIPVGHGPGEYWGLPGLILEVSDGKSTTLCTKVTINPKEKVVIAPPTKGKKVTQEEFFQIMKEKSDEMNEMYRPQGGSDNKTSTFSITIGG